MSALAEAPVVSRFVDADFASGLLEFERDRYARLEAKYDREVTEMARDLGSLKGEVRFMLSQVSKWWHDHANLSRLLAWLAEREDVEDLSDAAYFLAKPWNWQAEWEQFEAEQNRGVAEANDADDRRKMTEVV